MAYKDNSIEWGGGLAKKVFKDGYYNLDQAVGGIEHGTGSTAANIVTDIQLVFYMSFIIYRDGDKTIFPNTQNDSFQTTPPKINYFSERTKKGLSSMIWRFQEDLRKRGKPVYQDGRCDPAKDKISSLSKSPYTILMYNFYYDDTVKKAYGRNDWQDYLLADPLLPEQVRFELIVRSLPYTYM